jgi:hypothetical protein
MCHVTTAVVSPGDLAFTCCLFSSCTFRFVVVKWASVFVCGWIHFLAVFRLLCQVDRVFRHSLEAIAATVSENLAIVSSSKFQQQLGLNFDYCTGCWGFRFRVNFLRLTAVQCTKEGSTCRIKGPHSAPRLALDGSKPFSSYY